MWPFRRKKPPAAGPTHDEFMGFLPPSRIHEKVWGRPLEFPEMSVGASGNELPYDPMGEDAEYDRLAWVHEDRRRLGRDAAGDRVPRRPFPARS